MKAADVRSVMSSPVVTVLFNEPVKVAVRKMIEHQVGAVVVMSGGLPVGMVTERDVLKIVGEGRDPDKVLTSEVMGKPLVTVGPEALVTQAIALMKEKDIRRIPVVKEGKLVGIVTEKEIIRNLI
jgi:CBS domain-containing protein